MKNVMTEEGYVLTLCQKTIADQQAETLRGAAWNVPSQKIAYKEASIRFLRAEIVDPAEQKASSVNQIKEL